MLDKYRSALEELFLKVEDFILATTFKFWFWLGNLLELPYGTHETVYKDHPETLATLLRLVTENDELREQIKCIGVPQRTILGAGITGPNRPNNNKKLTRSEVSEIRAAHRAGTKQAELARVFDVNPATVSRIVRGQYHRKLAAA